MAAMNLVARATSPHLLFIGLRDGGPLALSWAEPPIRVRGQGISWPLGQLMEINSNILPVMITGVSDPTGGEGE